MMQHHKYSLSDIENMVLLGKRCLCRFTQQHIREENERIKEQNRKNS